MNETELKAELEKVELEKQKCFAKEYDELCKKFGYHIEPKLYINEGRICYNNVVAKTI